MSIIYKIMNDFHTITNLPIKFLDLQLEVTYLIGENSSPLPPIDTEKIQQNSLQVINNNEFEQFFVFPINKAAHELGYFLAGPFQSVDEQCITPAYKPQHLFAIFEKLFVEIIKNSISDGVEANPHITRGIKYIHENYNKEINLYKLCEHLNINACYFCVLFKNETKLTFSQYLNKLRIAESKKLLLETTDSIIDISLAVGFNNHNHFSATFKKLTDLTPTMYRNSGSN